MRLRLFVVAGLSLAVLSMFSKTARAADEITFTEGIEYSNPDDQHLKLNLAQPAHAEGRLPAVICIHGGGFRAGDRTGYNGLCKKLAERGYVAATIEYRLSPKYQFPAAIFDCKAAVRWLKNNAEKYHVDPDRIGVLGGSAGGHLVQFLGVTADVPRFEGPHSPGDPSTRVACVVNYYGPSDFTKSYGKSVDAAVVLPMWLGGNLETAYHQHVLASPLNWVTPDAAPTLLLHGTKDQYVNFEQAVWMHDRLQAAGVEVKLVPLEGAKHGFQGKDAERAEQEAFEFLDAHLKK